MKFFGDKPLAPLRLHISGGLQEIIAPVAQPLLFHPQRIMLADMRLVSVVARQLNVVETVKRSGKILPEIEILQDRVGFQRGKLGCG